MTAVYKKDFLSYFRSFGGYVYLSLALIVCGYSFTLNNVMGGSGDMTQTFSALAVMLVLTIPFMTVQVFLDGRELSREELLYTSSMRLVAAKFAAIMSMILLCVAATWIYVGLLSIFAEPYIPQVLSGQLGLFLLLCSITSLGLFISAVTHRRVQAFIMMYSVMAILSLADKANSVSSVMLYDRLMWVFSAYTHFLRMEAGVLSVTGVLYFVGFTCVFLLLTGIILERRREKGA